MSSGAKFFPCHQHVHIVLFLNLGLLIFKHCLGYVLKMALSFDKPFVMEMHLSLHNLLHIY